MGARISCVTTRNFLRPKVFAECSKKMATNGVHTLSAPIRDILSKGLPLLRWCDLSSIKE
uniref:Uncharacterized protein n=1 Tax=Ascaris lumbricoides TaxID=6252 RepID=A0A0M3IGS8_ASCLU